jgi:hypothetical protein
MIAPADVISAAIMGGEDRAGEIKETPESKGPEGVRSGHAAAKARAKDLRVAE